MVAGDGAHANRERKAVAAEWAEGSGALCFESVAFGVRSQPSKKFRKALRPLRATESNVNSPSLCADSTSAIRKTEKGYEEGCARGGDRSSFVDQLASRIPDWVDGEHIRRHADSLRVDIDDGNSGNDHCYSQ